MTAPHPGPTVLVIGDSFSGMFGTPALLHAGQFVWVYHKFCGFEWKWVDEFHPDYVWYIPTERLIPCWPGVRPKGLPQVASPSSPRTAMIRQGEQTNASGGSGE